MQTSRSDTRPTDSLVTQQSTAASVIIPAYNEAASISRCLSALLQDAGPQEFEVIVVCNGCNDDTAELARKFGPMVRVIEIEEGSKIVALGLGNTAARFYPRLYLDADLEVSTMSARRLVAAVADDEAFAAIGRMELELSGVGWLLRQYYAVWTHHGYLRNGKFGGVYALSKQGCRHVGVLPRVINDDEYVRRSIPPVERHGRDLRSGSINSLQQHLEGNAFEGCAARRPWRRRFKDHGGKGPQHVHVELRAPFGIGHANRAINCEHDFANRFWKLPGQRSGQVQKITKRQATAHTDCSQDVPAASAHRSQEHGQLTPILSSQLTT